MPYDPIKDFEKSKDDWYPTSQHRPAGRDFNKKKSPKRKLNLLPTRKYIHHKGTMKRVKVQPDAPIQCVVMRWMFGYDDALPTTYIESEKLLILADNGIAYVFKSRMAAKKAISHTCQREGVPGGHADFVIVNK